MAISPNLPDLLRLPTVDRLQRVEALWDSIAAEPLALPLTPEQAQELELRLADQEARPGVGNAWDVIKARLLTPRCVRSRRRLVTLKQSASAS